MIDRKNAVTPFGITIKTKLLELNRTQNWLIAVLAEEYKNGYTSGHTSDYVKLIIKGDIPEGSLVPVRVISISESGELSGVK